MKAILLSCILFFPTTSVFSMSQDVSFMSDFNEKSSLEHSGRTDKSGCHKNTKTGQRHCH